MASIREQIIQAVADELTAGLASFQVTPTVRGVGVFRSREIPLTRDITPVVVVSPDQEDSARQAAQAERNTLRVRVEVFSKGDPWDSLADPIVVLCHQLIMRSSAIAALCDGHHRASPTTFEASDADLTRGLVTCHFEFHFFTSLFALDRAPF
jgi:hypothetical protein